MNISLPDIPTVNPCFIFFFLSSFSFCSFAFFSRNFRFFQATKVCRVMGVKDLFCALNSARFCSTNSSMLISSFFSSFFLSFFSTNPGGNACRYLQSLPPTGQLQNHPYLLFSTASKKNLQI